MKSKPYLTEVSVDALASLMEEFGVAETLDLGSMVVSYSQEPLDGQMLIYISTLCGRAACLYI